MKTIVRHKLKDNPPRLTVVAECGMEFGVRRIRRTFRSVSFAPRFIEWICGQFAKAAPGLIREREAKRKERRLKGGQSARKPANNF